VNRNLILSFLFALIFAAAPCRAWNSTGHEIVAQITFDRLTPKTRGKIAAVLNQHPRLKEDLLGDDVKANDANLAAFLRAATWPDMVRYPTNPLSHSENHPVWHYVDYPCNFDGLQGEVPDEKWDGSSDPANLVQAMQKMTRELKDPATPKSRAAIDICWVEHLVGDIHQPLHAVSLYSREFPDGDRGGHLEIVRASADITEPLHSYWDGVEGQSMDPRDIRAAADRIEHDHPFEQIKAQAGNLSVTAWAGESLELSRTAVYLNATLPHSRRGQNQDAIDPATVPALPADYAKNARAVADGRIALAGYRLAAVLEDLASGW